MPVPDGFVPDSGSTVPAGFEPDPDFTVENAKDAQGNAIVKDAQGHDPNTMGTFASHVLAQVNPVTAVAALAHAALHPVDTVNQLTAAQQAVWDKAKASYQKGDYADAAVHALNSVVPLFGPSLDAAAEHVSKGELAAGFGDAAGMALALAAPEVARGIIWKGVPAVQRVLDARGLNAVSPAKVTGDLMLAMPPSKITPYTPHDIMTASPYLAAEHANSPVGSVEDFRDAADSAITQIEEHVHGYLNQFPNDQIQTKALGAARARLSQNPRSDFVAAGLKELTPYNLDQVQSPADLDNIRAQLNAENKGTLKRNNYDVATARSVDPAFAAREAAANQIRDEVYGHLADRGIPDVATLRTDEGSLIKLRNAAEAKIYTGDKNAPGSAPAPTLLRSTAALGVRAIPAPALVTDPIARLITPMPLTRNALIERAFSAIAPKLPQYPDIPAQPVPAGLLGPGAVPLGAAPDTSFVRSVDARPDVVQVPRRALGPGATPLGSGPDTSSVTSVSAARGLVVRDPATGRFKRVYTSEPQP